VARRAHLPVLPPPGSAGPDIGYRGEQPGRGPAPLPREVDMATLVAGQLESALELLRNIADALTREESATESEATRIAASTSSVTLVDWNKRRRGLAIYNDGATAMRVKFGPAAGVDSYTFKLLAGQWYEMARPVYRGIVTAVWEAGASGNAMVTELV
jgi:hypothetical protein